MSAMTTVSTGKVWLPGAEFVSVKFTSGDTLKSKKFSTIQGVVDGGLIASTSTSDTLTVSYSGSTVTLMSNATATNLQTSLVIWGTR